MAQTGRSNPSWRGGRSVASNGYVLIKVGVDHPLADVRGYAYEHRLIAFAKLGRPLRPGEIAHHRDGNKQNNDWDNIDVVSSVAEHFLEHRKPGSRLRKPGEANPSRPCACGCGLSLERFDASGRPRSYVSGHNPQAAPRREAIRLYLARRGGSAPRTEIARDLGATTQAVATALSALKRLGAVTNIKRGEWRLCG